MNRSLPCSVLVLTRNAAGTLAACLEGMRSFADVIVLDGGSTDATREIAGRYSNVRLMEQPRASLDDDGRIRDFSAVRNVGFHAATQPWFLFIDADELLTPELVHSMERAMHAHEHDAYEVHRRFVIHGEIVRRAAAYPSLHVRLVRSNATTGFVKPVHERFDLAPGVSVGRLDGDLLIPLPSAEELWPKYRRYLSIEAHRTMTMGVGGWLYWVLWRSIRSCMSYAVRLLAVWVWPGAGKRLPLAYEWQFLAYPLLLIAETSPLHRIRYGQFFTYLGTGGIATALNMGLYALLLHVGFWYVVASFVSEVVGFLSAFVLHKYVAFRTHGDRMKHFLRYCLLGGWNLLASTALIWVFVDVAGMGALIAKALVIACMVAWNFVLYKFVVYR